MDCHALSIPRQFGGVKVKSLALAFQLETLEGTVVYPAGALPTTLKPSSLSAFGAKSGCGHNVNSLIRLSVFLRGWAIERVSSWPGSCPLASARKACGGVLLLPEPTWWMEPVRPEGR